MGRIASLPRGSLAVVAALAVTACASTGGMRAEPLNAGVTRTFAAPLAKVVEAARLAMVNSDIVIDEASQPDSTTWMILGKKGVSAFSWGELVRVVVHEDEPGQVTVRVITKRKLATNITARGDWSSSLFNQIDLQLQQ